MTKSPASRFCVFLVFLVFLFTNRCRIQHTPTALL